MASRASLRAGQALVELTMMVGLTVVTIGMGGALAIKLQQEFKHHYVKSNADTDDTQVAETQKLDTLEFKKDLLLIEFKNKKKQLEDLEETGWVFKSSVDNSPLKLFEKDSRQLLLINNLGVISCLKNCD